MRWQAEPLVGQHVKLLPLEVAHTEALWQVAQHASIWRYMTFAASTYDEFQGYINTTMKQAERGDALPFVTCDAHTDELVGATSFLAVSPYHRRLEIGGTWITPAQQRTVINTEAKLLQLTDAFERLGCHRVELKTDSLNERSQTAIARIGGVREGTFRNHMVMPDGRLRHTVWFSITDTEWPEVKANLTDKLNARLQAQA